ncbi:MAG: DUF6364 family protein, partial [Burkholderiales bacterium]
MANITIAIPDQLLQRGKAYAAQREMSFSKLVEAQLKSLLEVPSQSASVSEILRRFSSGDISRKEAMALLDLDSYGELILLTGRHDMTLPTRA